jgi:histidyl-tRNA synthetase
MKPSTPKGTRDFTPSQMRKRDYLFGVLREHFQTFGYAPIETPAMENLSTLTGKYGEEGDQLLFKVLNNGDFLAKADGVALEARDSKAAVASLSKRGMRYDLTVPFARFVVQHQNELSFPFKRYAIQPVWRADRPQKGRYQEFYQCDADVVGSDSLLYEAELVRLFERVYTALGLKCVIRINHRGILAGLAESVGASDKFIEVVTAIDKLDKIGAERVGEELKGKGLTAQGATQLLEMLKDTSLTSWEVSLANTKEGEQGAKELKQVLEMVAAMNPAQRIEFDPTLARGLSYYTGCIFEVVVDTTAPGQENIRMGSIGGGGRYANLTEAFGGRDMSGVGISFGAERIYDVLEEMDAWPDTVRTGRKILLAAMDEENLAWAFAKTDQLRSAGIAADCYPEAGKPKRPMKYADKEQIPYVALIGTREREAEQLTVKELTTGQQETLDLSGLIVKLS